MLTSLSRRSFTACGIATLAAGAALVPVPGGRHVAAHEGHAGTGLAELGLPEVNITVTNDGFDGAPTELEAGRYLLNVTLGDDLEFGGAAFISPPEGLNAEQFLLDIEEPTGLSEDPGEVEASPGTGLQPAGFPIVAYDATFAGGVAVYEGTTGEHQAVIDLTPGEWILWGGNPQAPQVPLVFPVTGEMPGDLAEPESDIDVVLTDFEITIDGELTAGDHLLRVEHQGDEPHHVEIRRGPDAMTEDDIEQVLRAESGEETGELPFDPADLETILVTGDVSAGAVMWAPVTLEAGTYVALCNFPFQENAAPHALDGQYTVFEVE